MATAEAFLAAEPGAAHFDGRGAGAGAGTLAVVWNTGRCGSTLLGKALLATGAASISEPHWCDQLTCKPPHVLGGAAVLRCFRCCTAALLQKCPPP